MFSSRGAVCLAAILAGLQPGVAVAQRAGSKATITVRLYDLSGQPHGLVQRSLKSATRTFHKAGIEVVWLDCSTTTSERRRAPGCQSQAGPATLFVRILPEAPAEARYSVDALGYATVTGRGGRWAAIYFDRIVSCARLKRVASHHVLGLAIAHEMGHLLGLTSHSAYGVMRARWTGEDWQRAAQGYTRFSQQQSELMRREVIDRQSGPEGTQVVASAE